MEDGASDGGVVLLRKDILPKNGLFNITLMPMNTFEDAAEFNFFLFQLMEKQKGMEYIACKNNNIYVLKCIVTTFVQENACRVAYLHGTI